MEWTIQDLGSLGEFVGSIGVVVTLFYLSAQIRSQNKESHANALNALTQQWADVTLMFCDADLNLVWQRGLVDFHGLDDNERGRFSSVIQNLTQTFEGLFLQKQNDRMDSEAWDAIERRIQTLFSAPGIQQWWQIRGFWFTDSFQAFINQLVDDLGGENQYASFFDRPDGSR